MQLKPVFIQTERETNKKEKKGLKKLEVNKDRYQDIGMNCRMLDCQMAKMSNDKLSNVKLSTSNCQMSNYRTVKMSNVKLSNGQNVEWSNC